MVGWGLGGSGTWQARCHGVVSGGAWGLEFPIRTIKMGDWFVAGQYPDGHWTNTLHYNPNPPLNSMIEITSELVVHLYHIVSAWRPARSNNPRPHGPEV